MTHHFDFRRWFFPKEQLGVQITSWSLYNFKVVQDGHDVLRHEDISCVQGHPHEGDQHGISVAVKEMPFQFNHTKFLHQRHRPGVNVLSRYTTVPGSIPTTTHGSPVHPWSDPQHRASNTPKHSGCVANSPTTQKLNP